METLIDINKLIGKSYFILKSLFGEEVDIPEGFANHVPITTKTGENGFPLAEDGSLLGEDGYPVDEDEDEVKPWIPLGNQPLGDVVLVNSKGDIASVIWEDSMYTADGKEIKTRKNDDNVEEVSNAKAPQEDNI
jgi:hypothetical protein